MVEHLAIRTTLLLKPGIVLIFSLLFAIVYDFSKHRSWTSANQIFEDGEIILTWSVFLFLFPCLFLFIFICKKHRAFFSFFFSFSLPFANVYDFSQYRSQTSANQIFQDVKISLHALQQHVYSLQCCLEISLLKMTSILQTL